MLIMLYATAYLLIGRRWVRRSGYNPLVGWVYPLGAAFLALLTMVSPLSQFLLWLGPFYTKGSPAEWGMLAWHLVFPALLLLLFWRGRMRYRLALRGDFPILAVVLGFHLADILFALAGGYGEVLGLVVGVSVVHVALLALIFFLSQRRPVGSTRTLSPTCYAHRVYGFPAAEYQPIRIYFGIGSFWAAVPNVVHAAPE